jgi:Zn-dependent protease with chaperone function
MIPESQALLAASIMAFASLFSGIGAGALCGFFYGTNSVNRRGTAMLVGLVMALMMMFWQIWMGYHGFKV